MFPYFLVHIQLSARCIHHTFHYIQGLGFNHRLILVILTVICHSYSMQDSKAQIRQYIELINMI